MAIIPIFHVVAAEKLVLAGQTIAEGQIVSLDSATGDVVLQGAAAAVPYGLAGDTKSTSSSTMPGVSTGWQNRASDYFDETKASGKMTVYHSGGEFATDQFNANVAASAVMTPLYAYNGLLDNVTAQSAVVVAYVTKVAGNYPSGVPGVDINGDTALSGGNAAGYMEIKLII